HDGSSKKGMGVFRWVIIGIRTLPAHFVRLHACQIFDSPLTAHKSHGKVNVSNSPNARPSWSDARFVSRAKRSNSGNMPSRRASAISTGHGEAFAPVSSDVNAGDSEVAASSEMARTQANGMPACVQRAANRADSISTAHA